MPRTDKAKEKAYLKEYRKTPKYQEYHTEYMRKYREEHKEQLALASNKRCRVLWIANRDSDLHMRRSLLRRAKKRAANEGLPFDITLDDVEIPTVCPILGIPLKVQVGRYGPNSPSLDKFIPELGYVKGNVYVISHRANELKRDGTLAELEAIVDWMKRITQKC